MLRTGRIGGLKTLKGLDNQSLGDDKPLTEYEEKFVYPCESALYSALVSLTGFLANAFTPAFNLLSRPTSSSVLILMSLSSGSLTIVITSM